MSFYFQMEAVWLTIAIVALVIEIATCGLFSIWFVIGAIGCIPLAILKVPIWIQVGIFLLISSACICLLKPWARKYFKTKEFRDLTGTSCIITEDVDPATGSGKTKIGDVEWSVKSDTAIAKGTCVIVTGIEGVRLLVQIKKEV